MFTIEIARPADEAAILELVGAARLPADDLRNRSLHNFLVARSGARVAGTAGLEAAGSVGFLRSLVVSPHDRGRRLGVRLLQASEERARGRGIADLYLLAGAAKAFFAEYGYAALGMDAVPPAIRAMPLYEELAPTAVLMHRKLIESVLFVCTGNSARSIMAEALLTRFGGGRFRAYSAGSRPAGQVNPLAEELLKSQGMWNERLRSKPLDEFAQPDAPKMDLVITVCDSAKEEACPVWPGHAAQLHWGLPDPASVTGSDAERRAAFEHAFADLSERLARFVVR